MPSWHDGSSSSPEILGHLTQLDYAPDTLDDPTFSGIAVGCKEVCKGHKLEPRKCVAFQGTDTGRRFYLCQIGNDVLNCGFQSWLDNEWPDTLKNALTHLWEMYNESNTSRIYENYESSKKLRELADEKEKVEQKHSTLLSDVKHFMEATEAKVLEKNIIAMNKEEDQDKQVIDYQKERDLLKNEVEVLRIELALLKNLQKTRDFLMKSKQNSWEEEKELLKSEKQQLEHMLKDVLKLNEANKEKLKSISAICDENSLVISNLN